MRNVLFGMIGLVALVTPAGAASPDTYAMMAPLALPAGPAAVLLPAAVVASDPDALGTSMRLEDANGVEHPFTVLTSRGSGFGPDSGILISALGGDRPGYRSGPLRWEPDVGDPQLLAIDAADQPIDGIIVAMADYEEGPWVAQLEGRTESGWAALGPEQLLYVWHGSGDGASTVRDTVDVPHQPGPFRLRLHGAKPALVSGLQAMYLGAQHVDPVTEAATVEGPVARGDGGVRYTVRLPGPRVVTGLALTIDEAILARDITVSVPQHEDAGVRKRIERAQVGDVRIDETALTRLDLGPASDTLYVDVAEGRDQPLHITGAAVSSVGALLITPDAGPAPQTLYFGGTEPDQPSEVAIAADELARIGARVPADGIVPVPNPAFVPRPTRVGVDEAGAPLNLALWRWERAIVGGPGRVRVSIDAGALAHGLPGLDDLRVVDADGRSIPYTVAPSAAPLALELGPVERVERGGDSEITVALPAGAGVVGRIELDSDQPVFARDVELVRDRGAYTETLRSVRWDASAGRTLAIDVDEPLQGALLIRIRNGEDRPLAIRAVRAYAVGHELLVRVPEGGARLIYGNRRASAPDFDLALVQDAGDASVSPATVGPEQRVAGAAMTWMDRALMGAAFAGLAAGLLALTVGALRRRPVSDSPPDAGGSPPPEPPSKEPAP